MNLLLLLVWLINPFQISSKSRPDSLQSQLKILKVDSLRASTMLELAKYYYAFDQDSALYYTDQVLSITSNSKHPRLRANALNIAGVSLLIKSDFEKSLQNHFQALKIREALPDSIGIMESYLNIGNIYYRSEEGAKAAASYKTALNVAEIINHERGMSLLFNNLGNFYLDKWRKDKGQTDLKEAFDYLEKSRIIKEKLGDLATIINTYTVLGDLFIETGKTEKGEAMLLKALAISDKQQDVESRISLLMSLSLLNKNRKNYQDAMKYAKEAYPMALKIKSAYQIKAITKDISLLAKEMNNYQQAYEFLEIHVANSDSLFNEARQKIRDELFIQFETEKKEIENEKLLQEQQLAELSIQRRNEIAIVLAVIAVILLLFVIALRKTNNKLQTANQKISDSHLKLEEQKSKIQTQSETLKEQNINLKKANKFRDKLFSIISHDLRSPFNALQSSMSLWSEGDLSKQEMDKIVMLINKEALNAYTMLHNLLSWARVQIGSDQLNIDSFSLKKLVEENFALFQFEANAKNLLLENKMTEDIVWDTDRDRLNFIVRNILKNAIKFTPKGGAIRLSGTDECLMIQDNGIGMTQAQIEHLYGANQYSTEGTEGESGTGIGFMLSRDFAQSIGANIKVTSELGKGTEFIICFEEKPVMISLDS
jgi:signal transduction histidine kinase